VLSDRINVNIELERIWPNRAAIPLFACDAKRMSEVQRSMLTDPLGVAH
jgi:hypothetical protein